MIWLPCIRVFLVAAMGIAFFRPIVAQTAEAPKQAAGPRSQQTSSVDAGKYFQRCLDHLDLTACSRAEKMPLSPKEKSQVLTSEFSARSSCDAKKKIDEAIRLDPQNALAYFLRAECTLTSVEESVKFYREAIELNPAWKRYYVDVAILMSGSESYKSSDELLKMWQTALESAPDDPRVYAGNGSALKSHGKNAEAEGMFQKGLALNPSDEGSATALCFQYIEQKNTAKFRPMCATAIALSSGQLEMIAYDLAQVQEYALVEAAYRKTLKRGSDPQHIAELNLANTLLQEGKATEAAEMYRQYNLKHPGDRTYRDEYAQALETAGDVKKAEEAYLLAAEHPDCDTLSALGRFYLHQKRYREAFERFDRAFQDTWDCSIAVYLLTHDTQGFGPEQREIPQFQEKMLVRARPKPDEKTANTWYRFANMAHEFSQNGEAAIAYRKAADLSPKEAFPLGALGSALHDAGRHQEAVAAFEEAEKRQPGYLKSAPDVEKSYKESQAALKGKKP
jgi:tetratricopeptide (TPR) repeat protein